MRAICVDDERLDLEHIVSILSALPQVQEVKGFPGGVEALRWMNDNTVDLALVDIHMPGMNGMELAAAIKTKWPETAIVFLTADPGYAVEAFALHVDGYIPKPLSRERLEEEIEYQFSGRRLRNRNHVVMKTFGSFACLVDGKAISFRQAKCKELLAYLVDRRGSSVTRAEAFAILWEDRQYDRPMQKQLDGIIRSLRATLRENGIESILEMKSGTLRLDPDQLQCDLYRFLSGDTRAIGAYQGKYMNGYSWAELTEGYLTEKQEKMRAERTQTALDSF